MADMVDAVSTLRLLAVKGSHPSVFLPRLIQRATRKDNNVS